MKSYASVDVTGRSDEKAAEFQQLAERNGDVSYNRDEIPLAFNQRCSYVHNLQAIHVVCTSGDWDSDHTQGEPLDDCVRADFISYGDYVDSGYTLKDNVKWVQKRLTELTESDLKMINPNYSGINLSFDPLPATGNYTLRITMVTTEGKEIVTDNISLRIGN